VGSAFLGVIFLFGLVHSALSGVVFCLDFNLFFLFLVSLLGVFSLFIYLPLLRLFCQSGEFF
jgi:hypothetical protein